MDTCTVLVSLRRKRNEEERSSHGLVDPRSFFPAKTMSALGSRPPEICFACWLYQPPLRFEEKGKNTRRMIF